MEIKHTVRFGFSRHSKNLSLNIENIPSWIYTRVPLVALMVKNQSEIQETWIRSLGWEDPLEDGMLSLFNHITQNNKKKIRVLLIITFKTV